MSITGGGTAALSLDLEAGRRRWWLPAQAGLAGFALALTAFTAASLVLVRSPGLVAATGGLLAALTASVGLGLWAGAPVRTGAAPALRGRWIGAALAAALAGAFATAWKVAETVRPDLLAGPASAILSLLLVGAIPAYTLGLLLAALTLHADTDADEPEWSGGWGALGAVVGGTLVGVAGGAVAAVPLLAWLTAGPLLLALAAVLVAPTWLPSTSGGVSTPERLLYQSESPFSSVRVTELVYPGERQPERRLYVNDEEQSGELVRSGAPTLGYVAAAEQWLAAAVPAGGSYLFLGGGAYTLPRRVVERDSRARVTVVELDPEVSRVASRFFGVRREHSLFTVHGDARAFLEQAAARVRDQGRDGRYNAVFVDVYAGREALPYSLITQEAFERLRTVLRPDGWLLLNVIGVAAGAEDRRLWSVVRTAAEVFPEVQVYAHLGRDFPDRQNLLLAARAEPGPPAPPRAGLFEPWPRAEWPQWNGTAIYRDLFPARAPAPVPAAADGGPPA